MPVDWKTKESYQRLLAAMVAATQDMKLDYRKIATMYGMGATYDSIEGRFRIIKKEAATLRGEVDSGARPEAPPRGTMTTTIGSNPTTPVSTPKKLRTTNGAATGSGRRKNTNNAVIGSKIEKTPTKKPRGGGSQNNPVTLDVDDVVPVKEEPNDTTSSATSSMVQTPSFSDHSDYQHLPIHPMDGKYYTTPAANNSHTHHNTSWHTNESTSMSGGALSIVGTSFGLGSVMTPGYEDENDGSFLAFGNGGSGSLGYEYGDGYEEEEGI